jgi:hypothetical protein
MMRGRCWFFMPGYTPKISTRIWHVAVATKQRELGVLRRVSSPLFVAFFRSKVTTLMICCTHPMVVLISPEALLSVAWCTTCSERSIHSVENTTGISSVICHGSIYPTTHNRYTRLRVPGKQQYNRRMIIVDDLTLFSTRSSMAFQFMSSFGEGEERRMGGGTRSGIPPGTSAYE